MPAEALLIDRAQLLTLHRTRDDRASRRPASARRELWPESKHGVFTTRPEALTNDFFVNLLDMGTQWKATSERRICSKDAIARPANVKWTGTRVGPGLRLECAAAGPGRGLWKLGRAEQVRPDFVAAWSKVMNLDRFDLA